MTSFGSSKTSNSTPVPWRWNGAIAASRSFMRKPACRSLACALSDATISSTFYIGHCRRNDGFRSAPSDAWQPASNRRRALLRKRQSSGPASKPRAKIRKVEVRCHRNSVRCHRNSDPDRLGHGEDRPERHLVQRLSGQQQRRWRRRQGRRRMRKIRRQQHDDLQRLRDPGAVRRANRRHQPDLEEPVDLHDGRSRPVAVHRHHAAVTVELRGLCLFVAGADLASKVGKARLCRSDREPSGASTAASSAAAAAGRSAS